MNGYRVFAGWISPWMKGWNKWIFCLTLGVTIRVKYNWLLLIDKTISTKIRIQCILYIYIYIYIIYSIIYINWNLNSKHIGKFIIQPIGLNDRWETPFRLGHGVEPDSVDLWTSALTATESATVHQKDIRAVCGVTSTSRWRVAWLCPDDNGLYYRSPCLASVKRFISVSSLAAVIPPSVFTSLYKGL